MFCPEHQHTKTIKVDIKPKNDWIKFGGTWRDFAGSDADKKLATTGTLVRVKMTKKEHNLPDTKGTWVGTQEFLIGDINKLGGVCDDCMEFSYESIVVEYKKIL